MQALALIKTLRPHQWVKNLIVPVPLIFSQNLGSGELGLRALAAFGLFCLGSGVVYLINDLADYDRDRAHPVKCKRPIASGALSKGAARLAAALLCPGVIGGAYLLSPPLALVLASYVTLNLFYSIVLKHLPYLDVLSIAAGFLLRVLGGALAIGVPASTWLLACTALLACTLGLGKRAHELAALGPDAAQARAVLARYKLTHVKAIMLIVGVAVTVLYALYTLSAETYDAFGTRYLVLTTPFAVYGLLRFYQLVTQPHLESSPTDQMLRDPRFLANFAAYVATLLVVIYALPG